MQISHLFKKKKQPLEKLSIREQWQAFRNLPRFFKWIWRTNKYLTTGNILSRIIKAAIPLATLYTGKLIIDEIIKLINTNGDMTYLWMLVGIELGLVLLSELISRLITLLDNLLGDLFSNETSVKLIEHAAKLDLYHFENATFYDKLERARRQTVSRVILMGQVLSQFQDIITVIFLSGGLIAFDPRLLLILLVAVIPSFLGETHFNERSYSLSRSWTPERRELDYLRYIGASDETAKEVKVFGLSQFLSQRFKSLSHQHYEANKKLATRRALWGSALSGFGTLAYYFAYVIMIIKTVAGIISIGSLTFLAGSFSRMRSLLQAIMNRFSQIAEGALYLQDLFDFFEIQPDISVEKNAKPVPKIIREGFVFENVSFKYPGSDIYAIKDVSFKLKAGEKLALVGENGAGKTTLVKLLSRLYDPTEGKILLDGIDLTKYDLTELRQTIGIIFQDYIKFQLSASENIAVGQINEISEQEKIINSARKSLASQVIEKLPNKYDQVLGRRFTDGLELSGGEWQKIALARAYMRDAQLLILDEPTSALDARAEHEVFIRFSELIKGKTAVLISHRFSTVRMADRILFLERGQLKELGSHEELVAKKGKYAELFHLQARGYLD